MKMGEEKQKSSLLSGVFDVVVVGGGLMGSCTAYEVAKRGHSVLLLEQFDLLHRLGSSHGESRTIRMTYPKDYYTAMVALSFRLWEEAQTEAGYRVHTPTPHLDVGHRTHSSLKASINSCICNGVQVEVLNSAEATERFPFLALPEEWVAVVTPQGGVLHATKAVSMFQHLAAKHGAILCDRTSVTKILPGWKLPGNESEEGVLVATNKGSVLGKKCMVTAGAWSAKLMKGAFDLELPISPLHTTITYWQVKQEARDVFSASEGFPTFSSYADSLIYGTPSLEYPGLIKVALHSGYPCDPDHRLLIPDVKVAERLVGPWLDAFFKGSVLSASPVMAESCMYSMTPDEDFILDFLPGDRSILVAAGFSGHGFKMGPLIGHIMADLALQGSSSLPVPLEYFSISRFLNSCGKDNSKSFGEHVSPYSLENSNI